MNACIVFRDGDQAEAGAGVLCILGVTTWRLRDNRLLWISGRDMLRAQAVLSPWFSFRNDNVDSNGVHLSDNLFVYAIRLASVGVAEEGA